MSAWTTVGLIADGTFDDPANARVIYLAVGGLVLLAVALGVGTWLWWRSSKVEHPVLAPLEVMGTRRWWKSDFNERQRRIDEVRPTHADGDPDAAVVAVEAVDLEHVMVRDDPHTFDDLIDPDPVPSQADEPVDAPDVGAEEAVAEEAAADDVVAPDVVAPDVVAEEAGAEDVVAEEVGDEDAVADEPASDEPVLQPVAEVEAEPVPEPVTVADVEPEPAPVPVPPVVRSIVIDTAPKPRDTPADLGPEPADSDPTPVPIDPLLRMQSE